MGARRGQLRAAAKSRPGTLPQQLSAVRNPPQRAQIINIFAGRLPPCAERPAHSKGLVSHSLFAKRPSRSPVEVMLSEPRLQDAARQSRHAGATAAIRRRACAAAARAAGGHGPDGRARAPVFGACRGEARLPAANAQPAPVRHPRSGPLRGEPRPRAAGVGEPSARHSAQEDRAAAGRVSREARSRGLARRAGSSAGARAARVRAVPVQHRGACDRGRAVASRRAALGRPDRDDRSGRARQACWRRWWPGAPRTSASS